MAGVLGFEPRVTVLETVGLPINRHPHIKGVYQHLGASDGNRTRIASLEDWNSNH